MHLSRDVRDRPLVDAEGRRLGAVDDVVIHVADDGSAHVVAIEQGFVALARRLGGRFGRWTAAIARRLGPRRGRVVRVPWSSVKEVGVHVVIDVDPANEREDLLAGEAWAERVVSHVPGA
jgi:sporulation protein YlmC with PRC-barrel domain